MDCAPVGGPLNPPVVSRRATRTMMPRQAPSGKTIPPEPTRLPPSPASFLQVPPTVIRAASSSMGRGQDCRRWRGRPAGLGSAASPCRV